jgi:hypothetical protein
MKKDTDHCKSCGSDSLFSGWFDEDDLGYPHNIDSGAPLPEGVRWTTFCNICGEEQ